MTPSYIEQTCRIKQEQEEEEGEDEEEASLVEEEVQPQTEENQGRRGHNTKE